MKLSAQSGAVCPIAQTAELLSDPWTMLIARDLLRAEKRFCELERSLDGISTRTLTAKLKKLESQGIVLKSDDGAYRLTPKGKGLRIVERSMRRYGELYLSTPPKKQSVKK